MFNNRIRLFSPTLCLAASVVCAAPATGQDSIERIRSSWTTRQEKASIIRAEWTEKRTYPKGSLSKKLMIFASDPDPKVRARVSGTIPPEDLTVENHKTLYLDGVKMRYEHDSFGWHYDDRRFERQPYISTFDGNQVRILHPKGSQFTKNPDGIVRSADSPPDARDLTLRALMFAFRGDDEMIRGFDWSEARISGRQARVNNANCIEVEYRAANSPLSTHFWLDANRDFVVVRYVTQRDSKPVTTMNVQYRKDDRLGWVPANWSITTLETVSKPL